MTRKLYAALTLSLLGLACGGSPVAPEAVQNRESCPLQSMGCFRFTGTLSVGGSTYRVEGLSQDNPVSGFYERWHYVLSAPPEALEAYREPTPAWIGTGVNGAGEMYAQALAAPGGPALWLLKMRPSDPAVAVQVAALAGTHDLGQGFQFHAEGSELWIYQPARTASNGKPACQPVMQLQPRQANGAPYVFSFSAPGCEGPRFVAVYRHTPAPPSDVETWIQGTLTEGQFGFSGEPGLYQVALCYSNGFTDFYIQLGG